MRLRVQIPPSLQIGVIGIERNNCKKDEKTITVAKINYVY